MKGISKKNNVQILDDHEANLKSWIEKANPYMLDAALKDALNHPSFPKLNEVFEIVNHKFGTNPREDVVKFDMWLKKHEISEKRRNLSPAPTAVTGDKTEEVNVEAYKNYWQQFERKNAQDLSSTSTTPTSPGVSPSSTTPATSVPASTGITPDCKRKLELNEGLPNWIGLGVLSSCAQNLLVVFVTQDYTNHITSSSAIR